jgi:ankyrin repeat protein
MNRLLILCIITLMLIGLFKVQLHAQTNASSLHDAVIAGDLSKIKSLLEADSTLLESKDKDGNTPLIKACQTMQVAAANYLIDKGANVNAKGQLDLTPLLIIRKDNDESFDLIQRLIEKGADVNAKMSYTFRNFTVFCDLIFAGNVKVAKLLIDHGADINVNDIEGTPLQMIIFHYNPQKLEIAKLLIESGAKLQEFSYGNTELHLAAIKGCTDIIPLLVGYGANVNALNDYKHTPLYYATKLGHRKTAEALIAAGADQNAIIEKNFDKPTQLTASLREGEAYLWCLGNDGYAVKTKNHLLAFNPSGIANVSEVSLANGCINAEELKGQKTTILISHLPGFIISEMLKSMPNANYILSAKPSTNNNENNDVPPYHLAAAHDSFSIDGLQVHTIQAMQSYPFMSAPGLGYLVETDGLKIFYTGLHACKNDSLQMVKYRKEIDYLKPNGPIDIVILPIKGRHLDLDYEPYLYLIDQLSPKVIYLLSDELVNEEPKKCVKVLQVRNIPINYPEGGIAVGERFHYIREPIKK